VVVGIAVVLVGAVVWGVLGQVPSRVSGEGIILYRGSEVHPGAAEGPGRLIALLVPPGMLVKKGEALAELQQDPLQHDINATHCNVETLERQREVLARVFAAEAAERDHFTQRQRAALEQKISLLQECVAYLTGLLEARETALQGGIVTAEQEDVVRAQRRVPALEAEQRALVQSIRDELAKSRRSTAKQPAALDEQVTVLQERVRNLKESLQRRDELRQRGIVTPETVADYEERLHQTRSASSRSRPTARSWSSPICRPDMKPIDALR
jgi:HlyD family secretion protein